MLFQCLPESLLDRQVRFWLVLSLKTLALRRSTERRHRIYTFAEHKIPCYVERKEHQPPTEYHRYQRTLSYTLHMWFGAGGSIQPLQTPHLWVITPRVIPNHSVSVTLRIVCATLKV